MSKTANKRGKTSQIPLFISKLVQIVENKDISNVVSWTSTGDSFIIKNVSKFTQQVLPIYFKHRNFASFIRQLNMYGFRKTRHSDGDNVYMNQNFKQGSRQLVKNINRKIRDQKQEAIQIYRGVSDRSEAGKHREIQELKVKQKNLEDICKKVILQNQKLMQQNLNIMAKMEQESREKDKRMEQLLIFFLTQKNANHLCNSQGQPLMSLSNQAYNDGLTNESSPLQILGRNLDQNSNVRKMKQMISKIYNKKNKNNNNYTIVNMQPSSNFIQNNDNIQLNSHISEPQYLQNQEIKEYEINKQQKEDKSFLSINDFFNVEQEDIF